MIIRLLSKISSMTAGKLNVIKLRWTCRANSTYTLISSTSPTGFAALFKNKQPSWRWPTGGQFSSASVQLLVEQKRTLSGSNERSLAVEKMIVVTFSAQMKNRMWTNYADTCCCSPSTRKSVVPLTTPRSIGKCVAALGRRWSRQETCRFSPG